MNFIFLKSNRIMWGRSLRMQTCLSLLGVLPTIQAFSFCSHGSHAFSSVTTTPLLHHERSKSHRVWMSSIISHNLSWDEPEVEERVKDGEDSDVGENFPLMDEYQAWSKALQNSITALKKKRRSLESEMQKAEAVEDTTARAQLLVSNLYLFTPGVKTATVQDWENDGTDVELALNDKYDTASAEADALFAQVRKLKRGSKVVKDLMDQTSDAWDLLQDLQMDLDSACSDNEIDQGRLALVQDRLERSSRTTSFKKPNPPEEGLKVSSKKSSSRQSKPDIGSPASNIRKLTSPGGCIVLVGRNRRGNERLSLSIARGNDIWMHSRGCPGAHIVIFNRRGGPKPTPDCIQFAADLSIFYSDFRNEKKAPVTAAEPKHLQKPRGAPLGAIKVRQEWKTFIGFPENVPENLKIAREESGQSDEYRSMDKAKHRRRTKQVAKEERGRRKKANKEKRAATQDQGFY